MNLGETYARILELGEAGGAGEKFLRMMRRQNETAWERGAAKASLFSRPFDGGTVLDFGCKFGHLTPILQSLGAGKVINVDVEEEYLRDGERFIGAVTGARFVKSDDCYIDVPSESVDFILAKEAISHINPALLETFYSEAARVLRLDGELLISDGNNLDRDDIRRSLIDSYCQWEHGSSKELGSNYVTMRARMIADAFPDLPEERVAYFATNTSGLAGERLIATVRRAINGGTFTERAHRRGQLPINPRHGTAMERGFYPAEVLMALSRHGFEATLLDPDEPVFAIGAHLI